MLTKKDLEEAMQIVAKSFEQVATKEDLNNLAAQMATKEDLKNLADQMATKKEMEARFEKQEGMLEQRFQLFEERIDQKIEKKLEENLEEMTRQFNAGIEIIHDDFRGILKDKVSLQDDRLGDHEERITVLEQGRGLRG
jgi:DNA replicative helicase MCM subunit Mcm2 (Cdc46/Mcm family)